MDRGKVPLRASAARSFQCQSASAEIFLDFCPHCVHVRWQSHRVHDATHLLRNTSQVVDLLGKFQAVCGAAT
ncbi:MAG: hypothetical protein ACK54C_17920, partial [Betaproteobacteria bacterium]